MNPNHIAILPLTLYFVVNGYLYSYKGFNDTSSSKLVLLEKHAEFVCDDKGRIIKNRGNLDLKIITQTIKDLILGKDVFQMPIRVVTDQSLMKLDEQALVQERIQLFQIMELYKNA